MPTPMSAPHPNADIHRDKKKTLSYMIRLCQPSPLLFQYVDKSDDWLAGGVRSNPVRHIRPERRIGGRARLTFTDLWKYPSAYAARIANAPG